MGSQPRHAHVNIKGIKAITAALLKGTSVGLRSVLPIDGNLPEGIEFLQSENAASASPTTKMTNRFDKRSI
jgi:hypothetical protein